MYSMYLCINNYQENLQSYGKFSYDQIYFGIISKPRQQSEINTYSNKKKTFKKITFKFLTLQFILFLFTCCPHYIDIGILKMLKPSSIVSTYWTHFGTKAYESIKWIVQEYKIGIYIHIYVLQWKILI